MANSENEQLRKEVERQTRIIDALLDNNTQLKQALAGCRHLLAQPSHPVYSNDEGANGIPQIKEDGQPEQDGVNQLPDHILSLIDGVIQNFEHIRAQIIGVNKTKDAYGLEKDGVNESPDIHAPEKDGVNHLQHEVFPVTDEPNSAANAFPLHDNEAQFLKNASAADALPAPVQKDEPAKPAFDVRKLSNTMHYNGKVMAMFSITPQEMAENRLPVSYHKLYALLRKLIPKASYGGLMNTAQMLMKLHESPAQSLKQLQQLTHLSEDGATKRIMAMKKFGLIVRAPGRQLLLTAKARQLMDDAR